MFNHRRVYILYTACKDAKARYLAYREVQASSDEVKVWGHRKNRDQFTPRYEKK